MNHEWKQTAWEYDDSFYRCIRCGLETHQRQALPPATPEACREAGLPACIAARLHGPKRPTLVAVIGSSRFKAEQLGIQQRETLLGKVVLSVGFFHHVDRVPLTASDKLKLDELSKFKIWLADEVIVVNVHGYIGESTEQLIAYAKEQMKPISYLEALA